MPNFSINSPGGTTFVTVWTVGQRKKCGEEGGEGKAINSVVVMRGGGSGGGRRRRRTDKEGIPGGVVSGLSLTDPLFSD